MVVLKTYGATAKSVLLYQYDVIIEDYDGVIGNPIHFKDFLACRNVAPLNMLRPDKVMSKLLASSKKAIV